jgi:hypothetical protein
MAAALVRVLGDRELAHRLVETGAAQVQAYAWPQVRGQWLAAYRRATQGRAG